MPRISVVIPTHRGSGRIGATLQSLEGQDLPRSDYEVVVVLDGADPDARAAIAAARLTIALTIEEQEHAGAAQARNRGAAVARAPTLLFLDDDMSAAPGLLSAHLRSHELDPGGVVIGCFAQARPHHEIDLVADGTDAWWADHFARLAGTGHRFSFRDFCTGNVSLPRALFIEMGGFSQEFKSCAGEDYEFGIRLLKRGIRFRFAVDGVTVHRYSASLAKSLARAREEGRGQVIMTRLHPEVFPALPLRDGVDDGPVLLGDRDVHLTPWRIRLLPKLLGPALRVAQALRLRRPWAKLHGALRVCAYWEGACQQAGSWPELQSLLQELPLTPSARREVEFDLATGFDGLEQTLNGEMIDAVRLRYGSRALGRVGPEAGAESLRAAHIRRALVGRFARRFASALAGRDSPRDTSPDEALAPRSRSVRRASATFIATYDLAAPPDRIWGAEGYGRLLVLVRDGSRPLGALQLRQPLERPAVENADLVQAIRRHAGLEHHERAPLATHGADEPAHLPPVSVVVCTRDRPHSLRSCLASLSGLDYPEYEVIVVDNASRNAETAAVVAETGFRYVREERPGLDWARNCGARAARHELVAYIDDDARADSLWLKGLARGFASDDVMGVTGLILPAELETRAQHLFEVYGKDGMSKGFRPKRWLPGQLPPVSLIQVHQVGVGTNMAFRRQVLERVGGFDTALDVGTPSSGAGDLDMLHRVLLAGGEIRYEPQALVWHRHRRDLRGLRKQLQNNGRAYGVFLIKRWRERKVPRTEIAAYVLRIWLPWLLGRLGLALLGRHRLPARLVGAELWGAAHAPWAYVATYWHDRQVRRRFGVTEGKRSGGRLDG